LIQISENDFRTNGANPEKAASMAELNFQMNHTPQSAAEQAINSDKYFQTDATPGPNYRFQENVSDITSKQKITRTLIILVLILTIHIQPLRSIVFENMLFKKVDSVAEKWVNDSINRALIAYSSARALNAVISVFKGSSVQVQPWGMGVTIAIGEALEPLDDLLERFSWVMMVSLISLGIQKFMIEISPWLSLTILCTMGVLLLMPKIWINNSKNSWLLHDIGKRLLLAAFVVRFAVPTIAYLNDSAYDSFFRAHYDAASNNISRDAEAFKGNENIEIKLEDVAETTNEGWWDKVKQGLSKVKQIVVEPGKALMDLKEKMELLKNKASDFVENFIKLSVFFVLNTILLPIGFLWGLVKIGRIFLGNSFLGNFENQIQSKLKSKNKQALPSPKRLSNTGLGRKLKKNPAV
jgi:hypothetical protein